MRNTTTPKPEPKKHGLEPLGDLPTNAKATASVSGEGDDRRLRLRVEGLPDPAGDEYGVWLYSSIAEAKRLAAEPRGSFELDAALPQGADRYRFLDVSLEPRDGNPNPSGETVLRAPLSDLFGE